MGVPGLGYPAILIVLAGSLHRGRRSAWWLLAILVTAARPLSGVAITLIQHGPGILGLLPLRVWAALTAQVLLLAVLTATWPCFQARGDRVRLLRGGAALLLYTAVASGLGFVLVWLGTRRAPSLADGSLYVLRRALADTGIWEYSDPRVPACAELLVNLAAAVLVALVLQMALRSPCPPASLSPDEEARLRALRADWPGQDSLGYLALRRNRSAVFSASGKSAVTYWVVNGVSLAVGDPLGDPEAWPGAITCWLRESRRRGWRPAVLCASERGALIYQRAGLAALELGDEAIIDPAAFTLGGPVMRAACQSHTRLARAGYVIRVIRHRELPRAELARRDLLAARWRSGRGRCGFSMAVSGLADPADDDCVMVDCHDRYGALRGFMSLVPWGADGLSVELIRRDPDADAGITDYMITELLQLSSSFGIRRLSLNTTMFRGVFERVGRIGAGPFLRAERRVLLLWRRRQLQSRYQADAKYQPAWSPRFVCFSTVRDLGAIVIAAGRAGELPCHEPVRPPRAVGSVLRGRRAAALTRSADCARPTGSFSGAE